MFIGNNFDETTRFGTTLNLDASMDEYTLPDNVYSKTSDQQLIPGQPDPTKRLSNSEAGTADEGHKYQVCERPIPDSRTVPDKSHGNPGKGLRTPELFTDSRVNEFNLLPREERRKLFKALKKDTVCWFDLSKRHVKVDEKYKIKRYMILFSVNGKMYYCSGDDFTRKIKVACGESEETNRPILLIKTNVADDLFDDDENSVIVQPEMFVAKIEIADDSEAPGDTLTANFSYFAAFDKLSCNTALEVPDSNATNYLFDAFSSLLLYTSKALANKEMEEE